MSGTVHAAALAATRSPVPVRVVDSRTVAMGLGFAALAAAEAAADGASVDAVARRALAVADSSRAIFMVDSLEHLRRADGSGRGGGAGDGAGCPTLLAVRDGRIEVIQKVRTRSAAVDRLVQVAVESVERRAEPELAVHFLGTTPRRTGRRPARGRDRGAGLRDAGERGGRRARGARVLAIVVADRAP
ncbi:DegV family protein [Oerskovia sp. M15]